MFIPFLILIVGLVFGSFVTCVSYRLPLELDIVRKPSYCPNCDTKLTFGDLWPVASWALSKGKCRHCKTPVSARYPLTELATAVLMLIVYTVYGLNPASITLMLMSVALMIMIVVDLEHYIIPDSVQFALLLLAFIYQYVNGTPLDAPLQGFAIGLAIGLVLHYGYPLIRGKEGLGFGDVKFLAVAGLWLGPMPIVPFIFFAAILGVVHGITWQKLGKGPIFPFGPSLALSMFICLLFPQLPYAYMHLGDVVK